MRSLLALLCGAASLATASSSSHLKTSGTPPTTPTAGRKDPGKVPIIDIGPLFDYDDPARAATVKEIGEACAKWGFFQVTNHGMVAEVEADFCEQMKAFFALPLENKHKVKRTQTNSRGFADDELTKQKQDWKQLFDLGHVPDRTKPSSDPANLVMDGYNQWPSSDLPRFEEAMMTYYDACERISIALMEAIAESLNLPREAFSSNFKPHTSYLRLNWYPLCPEAGDGSTLGISRHTDAGALTVLRQDVVAGLEVYSGSKQDNDDGQWVGVEPVLGAMTINIGDMLQVWTNGVYAAPEHRVRANKQQERYSAPFFYNPAYDAMIAPQVAGLDAAVSSHHADGTTRYQVINWGYFRGQRFAGDFSDVGKEIQIEDYLRGSEGVHYHRQREELEAQGGH